jgi:hypothetical protein
MQHAGNGCVYLLFLSEENVCNPDGEIMIGATLSR